MSDRLKYWRLFISLTYKFLIVNAMTDGMRNVKCHYGDNYNWRHKTYYLMWVKPSNFFIESLKALSEGATLSSGGKIDQ